MAATRKIRKAVFPAAGLGTRFLPATKAQPKEMLPLVDKPIIQYVIEEAVASGLTSIIIVTGKGKNAIEDHFDVSYELERHLAARNQRDLLAQVRAISSMINVSYVRQGEQLGLGHAVLMAKDLVGDEPFAVMLGDDIIDSAVPCMKQMVERLRELRRAGDRHPAGAEGGDLGLRRDRRRARGRQRAALRIKDLVEKPKASEAPSDLAIIGRYILTPDIFEELERTPRGAGGEIQLTDGLRHLSRHRALYGYHFEGVRHDAGNKLGFLKATVEFALKREDLGAPFREYLRGLNSLRAVEAPLLLVAARGRAARARTRRRAARSGARRARRRILAAAGGIAALRPRVALRLRGALALVAGALAGVIGDVPAGTLELDGRRGEQLLDGSATGRAGRERRIRELPHQLEDAIIRTLVLVERHVVHTSKRLFLASAAATGNPGPGRGDPAEPRCGA